MESLPTLTSDDTFSLTNGTITDAPAKENLPTDSTSVMTAPTLTAMEYHPVENSPGLDTQMENEPSTSATPPTPSTSPTSSSTKNARCLKCRHCSYRTEQSALLLAHLRWHTKQRQKECETKESDDDADLSDDDFPLACTSPIVTSQPRLTARVKSPHKCPECTFTTSVIRQFRRHMNKHKPKKIYKCSYCGWEFVSESVMRRHELRFHINKEARVKEKKCTICSFSTSDATKLKNHAWAHTIGTRYKCKQCDFATKWKQTLTTHEHKEHKVVFRCDECPYSTTSEVRFQRHRHDKLAHNKPPPVDDQLAGVRKQLGISKDCTKGDTVLLCTVRPCAYTTTSALNLRRHLLTRHNERSTDTLTCTLCSFSTMNTSHMTKHWRTHDVNKYKCTESKCTFSTWCVEEMAVHVEEKHPEETDTFKCDECIYTTTVRSFLLNHQRLHEENPFDVVDSTRAKLPNRPGTLMSSITDIAVDHEQRYECTFDVDCQFVANRESMLNWHVMNVHIRPTAHDTTNDSANLHKCPQCAFRSPTGLKLAGHIERVHGGVARRPRLTRVEPPPTLTELPFSIVDPKIELIVDGIEVKNEPIEDSELSMTADSSSTTGRGR